MADSEEQDAVESFADALLAAIEERLDIPDISPSHAMATAAIAARRLGVDLVRRYCRLEIDVERSAFDSPVLFVANHGFGGIFDLNVFATYAALEQLELDRPVTALTHQLAWTLGVGPFIEPLGARPASHDSAQKAFAEGQHVLVFPGGDIEAGKPWDERNQVIFGGRSGFASLAIEHGVPIVPIVTAGAGESLLVLSRGERLARALRVDKLLRIKALPLSVSLPWGVSVGAVGLLPYLPLPTKLDTRVLAPLTAEPGEEADDYAGRVQSAMQQAMDRMTANRKPLLG
ncbi:MAG: lysophospholipid acyltransferase family protein [Candidatus Sericytochromatia bacterium]